MSDFDTDGNYDSADGIYNGSLCSTTAAAANDCNTNLLNVFADTFIVMSSNDAFFGLYQTGATDTLIGGTNLNSLTIDLVPEVFTDNNGNDVFDAGDVFDLADDRNGNGTHDANGPISLELDISDHFNGPLPSGTAVTVTSTNCDIDTPTGFEFGAFDTAFLTIPITLSEDTTTDGTFGQVTITVGANSFEFGCLDVN